MNNRRKENEWKNHYSVLSELDRKDPFVGLMHLSVMQPLFTTRKTLALLFQLAMANRDWPTESPEDRANMVTLYFSLLRIVEASYLIEDLWLNDKLTYHFGPAKKVKK